LEQFCSKAGSGEKGVRKGKVAQAMYTHVSKCKNDKRKKKICQTS
jgi:hypothetical protein